MPFDPTKPVEHTEVDAVELRNQFNGLKDLIDWNTLPNKPTPVADGTYTVGIGTVQNGTITVVNGIITGIQEASSTPPPPPITVAGAGDAAFNGSYLYESGSGMARVWRLDANHTVEAWQGNLWYLRDETDYPGLIPYQKNSTGGEPADDSWSALDGPAGDPTVS